MLYIVSIKYVKNVNGELSHYCIASMLTLRLGITGGICAQDIIDNSNAENINKYYPYFVWARNKANSTVGKDYIIENISTFADPINPTYEEFGIFKVSHT